MYILNGVIIAVLALAAVVLIRTLRLKPTPAKTAKIDLENSERAKYYGQRLASMVQKETISARGQTDLTKFYELHKQLEILFPNLHRVCEKHDLEGNLLFRWEGKGTKEPMLLMSHQDVVEANGEWEHAPFSGDIDEKGRVWGRGTVDTKGNLFCMMTAVEEMIEEGFVPEGDLYIASSCTEEISGDGAPRIVEYLKSQGVHLGFLMDEGGMIVENPIGGVKGIYGMVGAVEKGYGDVKFVAKGKGGHASAPGKNTPLVRLGKFMSEMDRKNLFTAKMTPTVKEMFTRMAPNMDFGMKVIFANMWLFTPLLTKVLPMINSTAGAMIRTTIAFTTAKGSNGLNVIPREAYVTANMRFIPHQNDRQSIEIITELAKKYDLETHIIYADSPCPIVDYNDAPFKLVEKVAAEVYGGIGICPYVMTGGTDAKYYTKICDNCLRFAPLYINNQQYASIHAIDENISQGTLPMGVDFYKKMIQKR